MIVVQLFLLTWIYTDRLSGNAVDGELHMLGVVVAALTLGIVVFAALGGTQSSWPALRGLWLAASLVSLLTLVSIDYSAVGRAGLSIPAILVVALISGFRRSRGSSQGD